MDDSKYYNTIYQALISNESNLSLCGITFNCGFDKKEFDVIIKALLYHDYILVDINNKIYTYVKKEKDERFLNVKKVEIGKVLKDGIYFGHFKYYNNKTRHTFLVGDWDNSNPNYPKRLTSLGWWTGD
jgi:hypothetical protein